MIQCLPTYTYIHQQHDVSSHARDCQHCEDVLSSTFSLADCVLRLLFHRLHSSARHFIFYSFINSSPAYINRMRMNQCISSMCSIARCVYSPQHREDTPLSLTHLLRSPSLSSFPSLPLPSPSSSPSPALFPQSFPPILSFSFSFLFLIIIIIIIIIIINRQFLTRRKIEPQIHPLQGRELSMYREIQWCFDMSITVKQMSLESVFERPQRLQIPDVCWQLVPCCWSGHSKGSSPKVCWSWDDDEVTLCGRSQSASATDQRHRLTEVCQILRCKTM